MYLPWWYKIRIFWYYTGCCTGLYPISNIVLTFIYGLMMEIKSKVSFLPSSEFNGLLFVDASFGLSDSKQGLQDMINVVHAYSKKWWHFEAKVTKCAVVVFRNKKTFDGEWFWRNSALPYLEYFRSKVYI